MVEPSVLVMAPSGGVERPRRKERFARLIPRLLAPARLDRAGALWTELWAPQVLTAGTDAHSSQETTS
jgi:hypothetical protein